MPEMQDRHRSRVSHRADGEEAIAYYQYIELHEQSLRNSRLEEIWTPETKGIAGTTSESRCVL